jgi:general secretion pathway protein G
LLAILGIILLVLSMSITHIGGTAEHVRHVRLNDDISSIKIALARYESITGHYPTTEEGLAPLVTQRLGPIYGDKTVLPSAPKDPWGNEYIYLCPGRKHPQSYDLYSAGPDRIPNTADDDWGE